MKKTVRLTALILLLALALSACGGGEVTPAPTAEPDDTGDTPEYTMVQNIRYWPEDADYGSCDYALIVDTPKFSAADTYGYAMNLAIGRYLEDIASRVENEYMIGATERPPYTKAACEVDCVNGITNVVFTEEHCYSAEHYTRTHVIMLDSRGEEVNLRDVLLNYHAEELLAAAVARRIDGDGKYYDLDAAAIACLIDVSNGGRAREDGCTVYIPAGGLADKSEGELAFDVSFSEASPDFVGDGQALTWEEYSSVTEFLGYVSNACVVRSQSIVSGAAPEYAATSFMGELAQGLGISPEAGRISVPKDTFEKLYFDCFGTEFPGIDTDAHDIRLEDDAYSVRFRRKEYRYNVDMLSAVREGDVLRISGDLIFGDFGYAFSDFVCHADIVMHENSASPFGFTLDEFVLGG